MFGGLTKTSSRIAITAALGMTLGGFAMSAQPAKAADLGGDCCADLEERVAELEATTVRKGNKKVSVTLSGWVVKLGTWWDDGKESNFYTGDKDTTLSSHFTISGQATIAPGWTGGYNLTVEVPGNSASAGFAENQFNDNAWNWTGLGGLSTNTLLSYMWIKSDKYGTVNWGQLSQATDNVALLPDLSGTIIEANAVLFDGTGMFIRPKGAKNANDMTNDFKWGNVVTCITGGGGVGADCNGYPQNGFRYDSPTFGGFSASTSYTEDDMWDVAVKYAADWNSIKFSAAVGYDQITDEGCRGASSSSVSGCTNAAVVGGGGAPNQGYKKSVNTFQAGASILHVPSGLFVYGLYQNEQNEGTPYKTFNFTKGAVTNSNANETDVWYLKAGIKRTWTPLGATVLFGEGGQYHNQFSGICGVTGGLSGNNGGNPFCQSTFVTGINPDGTAQTTPVLVTGSTVNRWGLGVVQEIDSAAMHVFARWQHLNLDIGGTDLSSKDFGHHISGQYQDLDLFQLGGVIFF